ncbi:MAG: DUF4157 domain-containing protein [Paracoccaceae bacterium]
MADPDPKLQKIVDKLKGKKAKLKPLDTEPAGTKGSALPPKLRATLEAAFDTDLSKVRVHTGGNAADCAKSINAAAFTQGSDIYFAKPSDGSNLNLLAHELTHVIQQNGGSMPRAAKKGKALVSK